MVAFTADLCVKTSHGRCHYRDENCHYRDENNAVSCMMTCLKYLLREDDQLLQLAIPKNTKVCNQAIQQCSVTTK